MTLSQSDLDNFESRCYRCGAHLSPQEIDKGNVCFSCIEKREELREAVQKEHCDACDAPKEIADDGEHVCGLSASQAYNLGWRRGNNAALLNRKGGPARANAGKHWVR